jgi:hypothetical protein
MGSSVRQDAQTSQMRQGEMWFNLIAQGGFEALIEGYLPTGFYPALTKLKILENVIGRCFGAHLFTARQQRYRLCEF